MSEDYKPVEDHKLNYNSAKSFLLKNRPVLLGILTFTILACLIGILAYQRFLINKEGIQKETFDFVVATKEKLQELLAQGISATKTLSFFIQKDGAVKDFDSVASQI